MSDTPETTGPEAADPKMAATKASGTARTGAVGEATTRTRALFERLASTSHRRSLTADRIFRQLRRGEDADA